MDLRVQRPGAASPLILKEAAVGEVRDADEEALAPRAKGNARNLAEDVDLRMPSKGNNLLKSEM